jgi:hypothetical protein
MAEDLWTKPDRKDYKTFKKVLDAQGIMP